MNAKLQERCQKQIENEKSFRQTSTLVAEESVKLGSLLYTATGMTENDDKIYECRRILQNKPGFFSNLSGVLQSLLLLKMTLADDPEGYIDSVIATHDLLTEDMVMSGLFSVLTASIICEQHGDRPVNEVVAEVLDMFAEVKKVNPQLSHDSDMAYIALMLLSGKADTKIEEEKEIIFKALKEKYKMPSDAAHATTLVLITSNKPAEEKLEEFFAFYEALKATGHATSTKRSISIYGAFTDLEASREEIITLIGETDRFLKSQPGYSVFSISSDFRRVVAATLVLQYYTIDVPAVQSSGDYTISTGISIEALLFIVLMSIVAIG